MKTASIAPLRILGPLAGRILPGLATIAQLSAAQAQPAPPCGNAIAILNEGKVYEAFDKLNGGSDKRLRFRLDGEEPCPAGGCRTDKKPESKADTKADARTAAESKTATESKPASVAEAKGEGKTAPPKTAPPDENRPETKAGATIKAKPETTAEPKAETKEGKTETKAEITTEPKPLMKAATRVEIVAGPPGAEKIIATVDLTGRSVASYCVNGLSRAEATAAQRRDGCPPRYLVNFLAIKLVDEAGPFARRDVSIQYAYRADAGVARLDHCMPPAILDGMFRRGQWTVTLADGAIAAIGETDFPRDRRSPVTKDAPFATTVAVP